MSERQFSNRRQQEQRQVPHSQKFVISAKESYASTKKAAQLTTQLHNLTVQGDWVQNRASYFWKQAKNYEAQGWMDKALEAKAECQEQAYIAKQYRNKIKQIEKEIARLHGVTLFGLQKRENYAMMKVEEPPSDNED